MTDDEHANPDDTARGDETESSDFHFVLPEPIRQGAIFLMDRADHVADWIEEGISRMWSVPVDSDVEDAEVTVVDDDESAGKTEETDS